MDARNERKHCHIEIRQASTDRVIIPTCINNNYYHKYKTRALSQTAMSSDTPRKRTTSFCCTTTSNRPTKAPRTSNMSSLRRTESFLCLSDMQNSYNKSHPATATASVRRTSKAEREKRKTIIDFTVSTTPAKSSPPVTSSIPCATPTPTPHRATPTSPSKQYPDYTTYRSSSPLSPNRTVLPGRPIFPRSKHEPDLYRQAIIARMRCTPEGQRILHMGPKLALSIMSATRGALRCSISSSPIYVGECEVVLM